jgi:Putative beta-lactamase-inhibitor-like, PepSY-like
MKYTFMVFIVVALSLTAKAQAINSNQVPPTVNTTFTSQFAKTDNIEWEQYGTNYSVRFGQNGGHYTALFDPSGKWLETSTEMHTSQLSPTVNQAISKQYGGYTVNHVNSLKQYDGDMIYEVNLMRGTEEKVVYLNEKGELSMRKYAVTDKMNKIDKMPKKQ